MRSERKYILNCEQKVEFLRRGAPFLEIDNPHCYGVSNVYFDDSGLSAYHGKEEGLEIRNKLRFRGYAFDFSQAAFATAEIKYRVAETNSKLKFRFPIETAMHCIFQHDWHEVLGHDTGGYILRFWALSDLRPTVKICYVRHAYVDRLNPALRITTDSYVSAFAPTERVPENYFMYPNRLVVSESRFVLEIKSGDTLPSWLIELIQELQLIRLSVSKYALGMERMLNHEAPFVSHVSPENSTEIEVNRKVANR